jgi:hypothetical protein
MAYEGEYFPSFLQRQLDLEQDSRPFGWWRINGYFPRTTDVTAFDDKPVFIFEGENKLLVPYRADYEPNPAGQPAIDRVVKQGVILRVHYHAVANPLAAGMGTGAGTGAGTTPPPPPAPALPGSSPPLGAVVAAPIGGSGTTLTLFDQPLPRQGGLGDGGILNMLLLSKLFQGQEKKRKKKIVYVQRPPASDAQTYTGQGNYPGAGQK